MKSSKYKIVLAFLFISVISIGSAISQNNNSNNSCITHKVNSKDSSSFVVSEPPAFFFFDRDGDGYSDEYEHEGRHWDIDGDLIANCDDLDSDGDDVMDAIDQCPWDYGPEPFGCPTDQGFREIIWLHGWKGSDKAGLHIPAGYVKTEYQVNRYTDVPNYNTSQQSLQHSATAVDEWMRSTFNGRSGTERNFIIAHSQGGLVTRQMGDLNDSQTGEPLYNGLITINTPHEGVVAADNLVNRPDWIQAFLDSACESLGSGPAHEEIDNLEDFPGFAGKVLVGFGVFANLLDSACSNFSNFFIDFVSEILFWKE